MGRGVQTALVAVAVFGCSAFDPAFVERLEAEAGVDASSDVIADAGADARDSEPPVMDATTDDAAAPLTITPPPRPAPDTEGPDAETRLYALRDAQLNQDGDRWRTIGYDLDGRNTQAPEYDVECVPPDSDSEPEIDGESGIDNAFSHRFFPLLQLALPGFETTLRSNQAAGIGAILLQVSGYNGTDNDPRINVIFTQSAAGTSSEDNVSFDGFELVRDNDETAPLPEWDGNDRWWARDDSFFGGDEGQPLVRDDNAYVADGQLVMRLPDRAQFLFFAGTQLGAAVRLTGAHVSVVLEGPDQGKALATGRWSILDLLDTGENVGICIGSEERRIVDSQLLVIADVRSTPGSGGSSAIECDAVSLAVPFTAVQGSWAGLGPSIPLPNPCAAPE